MAEDLDVQQPEQLADTTDLADALESDRFKRFLDHVPFGVAVSELQPRLRITYFNLAFERLLGQDMAGILGGSWADLPCAITRPDGARLADAIETEQDHIGIFVIAREGGPVTVDAWSNVIHGEDGAPLFRLVAIAETGSREESQLAELEQRIREKDTLLRELQHRVKNNLQMITALIRMEARNVPTDAPKAILDRLAGRISSLSILYQSLSEADPSDSIDLGVYLSQVASSVLQAHASEGIRLDLRVDAWPVSVNVAMPAGLVVNELLTNSLKHAFRGRDGGTILLHSLVDDWGCRVVIADDGVGLDEGSEWPHPGKLGSLIVESLRQNARARVEVASAPGKGMTVTIFFAREDAQPGADPAP
jgi:two-component sensor histidine kinase